MLESFSIQAVNIIDKAKTYASEVGSEFVGSEHLLIAMFKTNDSICHFLLSELNIKEDDLKNALLKMEVIHKSNTNSVFTKKFVEIIENAKSVAKLTKSDYVYDEHLFYSLLELKDSVGYEILSSLNIDTTEMLLDIEEIFNFFEEEVKDNPFPFLTLVTKEHFSHPYIKRKDYIEQIIYILRKKQKNNPLLVGKAGVGKSAIIEGLAEALKDEVIYELDLGGVVAGTKYRGELEEKLIKALEYIKEKKAIVFIDEIHNIVGAGSNDGSLDIANILKPYLTKPNLRLIGATTLDEYYKWINKDKALSRRFQNVYIDEPSKEETFQILKRIKSHYENYHHVFYSNKLLKEIINKCDVYIPNRSFPDKAIDVLDEVGAISSLTNSKNMFSVIDKVIYSINGIRPKKLRSLNKITLIFPCLKKYYINFINKDSNLRNIAVIKAEKGFKIEHLLKDIFKVFSVKMDCFLEVDCDSYIDSTSLTNLIGSSKGYVGYDQGGILFEHILKTPLSVVYFKNFEVACLVVQNYIKKLLQKSFVFDNKGRKIFFSNTIFVIEQNDSKKGSLGFENTKTTKENINFDVILNNNIN